MKTMYNNEAIEAYLLFAKRVIKKENVEETEKQYQKFLKYYKSFKEDNKILFDYESCDDISKFGIIKIQINYNEIEQIFAYIHFCLNIFLGFNSELLFPEDEDILPLSFTDFTLNDIDKLEETLPLFWYLSNKKEINIVEDIWSQEALSSDDENKILNGTWLHKALELNKEVFAKNGCLYDENELSEDELEAIKNEQYESFSLKVGDIIAEIYNSLDL